MTYLHFLRANWPFLTAGILMTLGSSYGQTFFISLFAAEIKTTFALTDGGWGAAYTVATTASAIVMVWAGALTDRFRIRVLARLVMLGLTAACLMMTQAPGVWWLVLTVFLLRFFGQGMMSHLAVVAMARWFVATRGKALSIATLGFAVGTAFFPFVFAALMTWIDWRFLWVGAAVMTLVTIPILSRLLRYERTPQSMAEDTQAAGMQGRHWTRSEVLRSPIFWLMVPVLLGPPAWGTALGFHQVHLSEVKGWNFLSYVSLYPLSTGVAIISTFTAGWAIDRFGSARLMPLYMIPFAAAFFVMWQATGIAGAALSLAIVGIGQGLQSTLASAFWAEFFGTLHLGAIKAVAGAIMVFGSAIGPGITGVFIDLGFDFDDQMIWLVGYFVIAALCATLAAQLAARRLPVAP